MLEANYLTILLKPNFEKPVDTIQDILDRGLKVITVPGSSSAVEIFKTSPARIDRELGERMVVAEVIFSKLGNSDFILNFPKRIGINIWNWEKVK